jgi:hypothetical protein
MFRLGDGQNHVFDFLLYHLIHEIADIVRAEGTDDRYRHGDQWNDRGVLKSNAVIIASERIDP